MVTEFSSQPIDLPSFL